MYIYFLPLSQSSLPINSSSSTTDPDTEEEEKETMIPTPTSDGGKEHTAARFLPASTWLRLAQTNRIILFPPQYFLLHLISPFLSPHNPSSANTPIPSHDELAEQRKQLVEFVKTSEPPWGEKVISPLMMGPRDVKAREDGRVVLGLEKPGPELVGKKRGEFERVVLVEFAKGGPRRVDVRWRKDVLGEVKEGGKL